MNNEPIRGDAPVPASPNTPQTPAPSGQPPAPDPAYPSYPVSRPAEPWQFSPPPTPRQPVPASSLDGGMTLLVFAAAWCFLHLCWPGYMGLGMFLFTLFFAGIAVGYRLWSGSPIPRGSYVWLGVMLLSAASFPILDNGLLSWLNLLFLMLITVYWVAVLGENRVEPRLGKRLLADLLNHLFIVPFQNFGCFGTVLARSTAKTRLGENLLIGAVTLLCSFPVLWFVCQELSTVAAGFGELLEQFAEVISLQNILSATTLFAIPTAFYLYGLLYGNQHKRYTGGVTAEKLDEAAKKRQVLPPAAAYALLSVLCLIYALFFVIGAAELITFSRGGALTPYDYSQFAREGFFELCRVSVVNLLVLWGIWLLLDTSSQRSSVPARIFYSLLCCQTLLLIALALCKMGLYIHFCGVTWLRVSTTWFMVLLAVIFGLMLLFQFREIPLVRWTAAAFCVLFLALCWMDLDRLVVKNAIWRYEETGDAMAISYGALVEHSVAGAPELYELWLRESAKESSPVEPELVRLLETAARWTRYPKEELGGFGHWNLQRAQAWSLCRQFLPQPELEP